MPVARSCECRGFIVRIALLIILTSFRVGYYTPIYAMVNLFILILTNPSLDSVKSDLTLLEVGAGYFARLDFETEGYCSISFPRELVQVARNAADNAKASESVGATAATTSAPNTPDGATELLQTDGDFDDEVIDSRRICARKTDLHIVAAAESRG
jgi:hypothetical protein